MKISHKTGLFCLLYLGLFGLYGLFLPDRTVSVMERRPLAQKPALTLSSMWSGAYMSSMDTYLSDQFPFRDALRTLQVIFQKDLFLQKDINGYYKVGKGIYSLDATLHADKVIRAARGFSDIAGQYFPKANIYYSLIPDKNYFVAESNGYPMYDYSLMENIFAENFPNGTNLPLWNRLTLEDYYLTDPHWKQENLIGISSYLCGEMKASFPEFFADFPVSKCYYENFVGSYGRQSGLSNSPEKIYGLSSSALDSFHVTDWETQKEISLYHPQKLSGPDSYDFYLAGSRALLTIENPSTTTDRELFLFRDSFGSPIAPLLSQYYAKVTVIDLRYVSPEYAFRLLSPPEDADVLFLYSTMLLNNSDSLRFF